MVQLSIIIVNYNVKYFLEECLHSVKRSLKNISAEIFVVDNNSVDGSVEWMQQRFPDIHIIANQQNVGFSKANNQAIRLAKGEFILLLNPDTVVQEDTFEKCLHFMQSHLNAGAVGVKMVDGKGKYLPESKRGFPSPATALYKMMGLHKIFPTSKIFNQYYVGNLSSAETNAVPVLAGAFMFIRKNVLDKIGLLDEDFFMYGEDIDLSWRIIKAGFKNYYLPTTQIIHYKGESTKRATFNYVKHFYNAMLIFLKKHFAQKATAFILLLQCAIFLRGIVAYFKNFSEKFLLPFFDAAFIYVGLFFIKSFWENNIKTADNFRYPSEFHLFVLPVYILIWLLCLFFSGGYDKPIKMIRVFRGVVFGSLMIASVYAFLPETARFSRAIILLGSAWVMATTLFIRQLLKWISPEENSSDERRIVVVGTNEEANRVHEMINRLGIHHEWLGAIHPKNETSENPYLARISQLYDVVAIFKINEIIFCAKDISAQEIIHWMTTIGAKVNYKIVGEEGMSIVGSNSKNTAGDLYAMDFSFSIATAFGKRNKMMLDYLVCAILLMTVPIWFLFSSQRTKILNNFFQIVFRKKTWMGYKNNFLKNQSTHLPKLLPSAFFIADAYPEIVDEPTLQHLRFLYAKNYSVLEDVNLIWKCLWRK